MKYRVVMNCPQEEFFDAVAENFLDDYYKIKKVQLDKNAQLKGTTYQKRVPVKNKQKTGDKIPVAQVKMLDYERPYRYRMEYKSATYNKIVGIELKTLENGKLDIVWEEVTRKGVKNASGESEYFDKKAESDEISKASLMQKYQIYKLVQYCKRKAKLAEKEAE